MKNNLFVLAVALLGVCAGLVYDNSFLDAEELEKLHYAIQIDGKPVKIGDVSQDPPPAGRIVPIVNKFGQKYHCTLPLTPLTDRRSKGKQPGVTVENDEGVATTESEEREPPIGTKERIQRLLEPLKKGNCLLRTRDWWTYELCVGRSIRQFHLEGVYD